MSRAKGAPDAGAGEKDASGVRAVDRAVAILRSFTVEVPSMSVIEIQRRVGLSRPTLYRLLQTLENAGMVEAEGDPQRFRLAAGVMQLARTWLSGLNVVDVARPLIDRLRDGTGETAALFVLRGDHRLCVLEQRSRHVLSISRGVGDTGPITRGASGKAIVAFLGEADRAAALSMLPPAERSGLEREFEAVRRNGYAISRSEVFAGAVALAAPYHDHTGEVAGSIGVFGPDARLTDDTVAAHGPLVVETAAELSAQLGHGEARASPPEAKTRKVRS